MWAKEGCRWYVQMVHDDVHWPYRRAPPWGSAACQRTRTPLTPRWRSSRFYRLRRPLRFSLHWSRRQKQNWALRGKRAERGKRETGIGKREYRKIRTIDLLLWKPHCVPAPRNSFWSLNSCRLFNLTHIFLWATWSNYWRSKGSKILTS